MHILLVNNTVIPVGKYGGTERIIWWLGKALNNMGHKVSYLVAKGSSCPFADVYAYNPTLELEKQIPPGVDFIHVHFPIKRPLSKPYMVTIHGNGRPGEVFDENSVFISRNHALRHNSETYVYNGLDWDEYGKVDWNMPLTHFLFLGKASRKEKNLKDCIAIARNLSEKLYIIGGRGISLSPYKRFKGYLGGTEKSEIINSAKALLFPVRWHEPFGLAILESMYFGCPVFGSTYGSLPELVSDGTGFLSNMLTEIQEAASHWQGYDRRLIHQYAVNNFSAARMANDYLAMYERVLNGERLNQKQPCALITESLPLLPLY